MMTGMHQTSIGAHNHRSHREDGHTLPEPVRVITHYFRQAGYFVTNGRGTDWERPGKTDWNFTPTDNPFDGTDWAQRAPGQPFFAQYNFSLTHRDFVRYPERPIDPAQVELPPYYLTPPSSGGTGRIIWSPSRCSIAVNRGALEAAGGRGPRGQHLRHLLRRSRTPACPRKQWLYEGGIRVPLIVRKPGGAGAGKVSKDLVSLIDLAPTMMRWAGITPPAHLQGRPSRYRPARVRRVRALTAATKRWTGSAASARSATSTSEFLPGPPTRSSTLYKKLQYPALGVLEQWKAGRKTRRGAAGFFMADRRPEGGTLRSEGRPARAGESGEEH